ncbi:MAG TPA: hypothetical protein VEK56_15305 [Vicinamibacterales bacterium]|nr:hypothetical protein [Vicinamibacterales bacterium]
MPFASLTCRQATIDHLICCGDCSSHPRLFARLKPLDWPYVPPRAPLSRPLVRRRGLRLEHSLLRLEYSLLRPVPRSSPLCLSSSRPGLQRFAPARSLATSQPAPAAPSSVRLFVFASNRALPT